MRSVFSVVLLGVGLLALNAVCTHAEEGGEQKKQDKVLEGRLVDLVCYTMDMSGDKHTQCALQCAQKGLPVGLREEKTGKLFTVLLPSPGLANYMEQTVRITGMVHHETLLAPKRMEIREGEGWKAVDLPSAM